VRKDLEDPIVGALNTKPKYVGSNTLTDPQWAGTTVLSGDLAASIRELKARPGGELQMHGSGALIRWLLENELLDELSLLICPVVVGQGARLVPRRPPGSRARPHRLASPCPVVLGARVRAADRARQACRRAPCRQERRIARG
jgi:dihydrofolate reductase